MITLKTLKWSNCFSYGEDNEIDLSSTRLTQILGSNGVGKSSIPLILEEVLFNKNSKGIKKAYIPNRELNAGYSIYLSFSKGEDEYEIDLQRKSSLKVKFLKNGEDIGSHTATNTYKTIQEVIGVDFKTFSQVVYQNTNASLNFLTATDANRKKFLIDLLGLEKYVNLFEIFKEASREVEQEFSNLEGRISTIEKWLENNRLTDTTPRELVNIPKISEEDEDEASSLMAEIKNISSTNRQISQNNQYKKLLKEINITEIRAIDANQILSYDEYQSEVGAIAGSIGLSQKIIKKMESLENVCPTCEQPVSEDFKEKHISEEKEKIKIEQDKQIDIQKKIEEIQENNKRFRLKSEKQKEWEDLYRSVDSNLRFGAVPDGTSPQGFVDGIAANLKKATSIHHVHQPEIVLDSPQRARGVWAMMDYVEFPPDAPSPYGARGWVGWGFYEEEYVLQDGAWLIDVMRLARLRMDELDQARPAIKPGRLAPNPEWL